MFVDVTNYFFFIKVYTLLLCQYIIELKKEYFLYNKILFRISRKKFLVLKVIEYLKIKIDYI